MPATFEAIVLLILVVTPGFLCVRIIRAEMPSTISGERNSVILSILFSIFIHLFLLPYTWYLKPDFLLLFNELKSLQSPVDYNFNWPVFRWLSVVLLLAPIGSALVLSKLWRMDSLQPLLSKLGISIVQLTPTAWDWLITSQTDGCWIVVEMDDGSIVGGEYGSGSFASLSPQKTDLFLEREYYVDEFHNFGEMIPDTIGLWVNGDKVRNLHLYNKQET